MTTKRWTLSAPEVLFLAGSLFAGLGYLVLFPPLSVADEPAHFYRTFALTSGELLAQRQGPQVGARLPVSLTRVAAEFRGSWQLMVHPEWHVDPGHIRSALSWPLAPSNGAFVAFPTAAQLPAVVYFPQAAGLGAGRLLGLGPLPLMYLGRLGNLLLCTLLIGWAIRIMPLGRWAMSLIALTPMAVSSRASLSADALTTAAAFVLVAAVARLAWGDSAPSAPDRFLAAGAALLVCLTKLPYVPLLLVLLVVPAERLGLRRHRRFWCIAALAVGLAIGFSTWVALEYGADLGSGVAVDRDRQVQDALAEPGRFLHMVTRQYLQDGGWYLEELVGVWIGWMDVHLPISLCRVYCAVFLGLLLLAGAPHARVLWWQRLVLVADVALLLVLIAASQYAVWTAYRADQIQGLQGRYFLPAAPLVVLALHRRPTRELPAAPLAVGLGLFHLLITAVAWALLFERHYG